MDNFNIFRGVMKIMPARLVLGGFGLLFFTSLITNASLNEFSLENLREELLQPEVADKDIFAFFEAKHPTPEQFNEGVVLVAKAGRHSLIRLILRKHAEKITHTGARLGLYNAAKNGHIETLIALLDYHHIQRLILQNSAVDDIFNGALLKGRAKALITMLTYPVINKTINSSTFNFYLPFVGEKNYMSVIYVLCTHEATNALITPEGAAALLIAAIKTQNTNIIQFILGHPAAARLRSLLDSDALDKAIIQGAAFNSVKNIELLLNSEWARELITYEGLTDAINSGKKSWCPGPKAYRDRNHVLVLLKKYRKSLEARCFWIF